MATAQVRYSAADRREQILEAATQLFARQGFQGTTTKQISEQTGVTEALIFRHFASKDELYWAVIERKITAAAPGKHMRERLSGGGTHLEILSGGGSWEWWFITPGSRNYLGENVIRIFPSNK